MKQHCCICGKNERVKPFKQVGAFSLWRCVNCSLVFFRDYPLKQQDFMHIARADLKVDQKEKVEYWSFPHLYEKHKTVFHRYFNERLNRVRMFKPDMKNMFDIGCGYGFWLKFCQEQGIEAEGLDVSQEVVNFARQNLRLKVKESDLETHTFNRLYDAIVVCDLLEHLVDPASQLKKIHGALSPSGVLFIQVPNILGFKLPPFHGFGLPYHIWQFDLRTLERLLRNNGFKTLKHWTGVMGVIGVYESGEPSVFDKVTWQLARNFGLGNRLMIIAKKE